MQVSAAGNWTSVRSKNFLLIGDVGESDLRALATRLERFRDATSQLLPRLTSPSTVSTNVIVFHDAASYRSFKPTRGDGHADDAVLGYFLNGVDANYITLSVEGGDPNQTICHEYFHLLLHSTIDKDHLPTWLDEGLAQYYETLQIGPDGNVMLGSSPQNRLRLLKHSSLLSTDDLLAPGSRVLHGSDEQRALFYSQAWALAHYLKQKDPGGEKFDRLFAYLAKNQSSGTALSAAFGIDLTTINQTLRTYIDQSVLPLTEISLKRQPPSDGGMTAATVSEARSDAYLGDLLCNLDRMDEAEILLRKSLAVDGDLAVAHESLGLILIKRDNFVEAVKHLELVVKSGAADHLAFFYYAYALSREHEDANHQVSEFRPDTAKKIRFALTRAIELEPRFVESYRLLAFLDFVNGTDLDEAVLLLRKGLDLQPSDQDIQILLAKVLLTREKYDDAKALAQTISATSTDNKVRADANDILKTVREYDRTRLDISIEGGFQIPWSFSLVFLKRSWITEQEVASIERDRDINNLNRALERPPSGERQILGNVSGVACSGGAIKYGFTGGGRNYVFTSRDFQSIRMEIGRAHV